MEPVSTERRQAQLEKLCTVLLESLTSDEKVEAEQMLKACEDEFHNTCTKVELQLEAHEKVCNTLQNSCFTYHSCTTITPTI